MDPILSEVYSTVLPAAPFVIGAYVGIWLALFAYVFVLSRRAKRTSEDVRALERALEDRERRPGGCAARASAQAGATPSAQ